MKTESTRFDSDGQASKEPPSMPFWEMKPDGDGRSTIDQRTLADFIERSVSGNAAPIWMRAFRGDVRAVWFNVLPVGWIGEWHPSPALQWVVPLSGSWFIETQDGIRVEMGPGEIHWGADLAGMANEKIAHRSGQLGDVPCVQMMVQFDKAEDVVAVAE